MLEWSDSRNRCPSAMSGVEPWQTELALDEETVRLALRSQFPTLGVGVVEYLHEGWDSAVYLVDGAWVFRFPKRREREPYLRSELSVLEWLKTTQLSVRIPDPAYIGQPGPIVPCGFMGYRLLAGTPGDCLNVQRVDRRQSAKSLGQVLTALHSLGSEEIAGLGLATYESPVQDVLLETMAMRETVFPHLSEELKSPCLPFLNGTCVVPESSTRQCLVHGDLTDEHILLDETGCVSGVIDWGDSCLADPAIDFSGLYAWLGEDFVRDVLDHYTIPWDDVFLKQIAFRARCTSLITLGWSLQGHDTSHSDRLHMVYTAFGIERRR